MNFQRVKMTLCCLSIIFFQTAVFAQSGQRLVDSLNLEQREYFDLLYRDTWNYLSTNVENLTGLPYDSSAHQPPTSMSNVGFYMAATAIAYRTGLISREEAQVRVLRCLVALEQIEKWRGFPRPWVLVRSLKPAFGEEFSYGSHIAVLIGGLIVVKTTFPELTEIINGMLSEMQFKDLYEPKNGWLKGGYNIKNKNFAVQQPWGHWYYQYFASETRLLSFYMIARKIVPKDHWEDLVSPVQQKSGRRFYVSNCMEAGLASQYIPSLFLDERFTFMGESQVNYAIFQREEGERLDSPVWGWSSCEASNGDYLTIGELKDEVVSPHASILTAIYFPQDVFDNLQNLESLGARPQNSAGNFGFKDSVNWQTGQVSQDYLTSNQGMIFLTLANLLYDGIVWESFEEDNVVREGLKILNMENSVKSQAERLVNVSPPKH